MATTSKMEPWALALFIRAEIKTAREQWQQAMAAGDEFSAAVIVEHGKELVRDLDLLRGEGGF